MTTSRLRTTTFRGTWTLKRAGTTSSFIGTGTDSIRDAVPGPCNVIHTRQGRLDYNGLSFDAVSSFDTYEVFNHPWVPQNLLSLRALLDKQTQSLDWEKLPSSSTFGLLQIIAEIDDTIAMFTSRFWRQLSYGSFTWGVIPFVSDLHAVCDAVSNLAKDIRAFSYEDSYSTEHVSEPYNWGLYGQQMKTRTVSKLECRLTGDADISFQNPASRALDWLGFHPDLATAWDLIPFSFVVDYLLPIGDFLESFRQGGWVKVALFNGWISRKLIVHCDIESTRPPTVGRRIRFTSKPYVEYSRFNGRQVLVVPPASDLPEFKVPSFTQLFNMLYLTVSRRR